MSDYFLSCETRGKVLEICREIALPNGIVACSFYGPHVCGYADGRTDINVLLVVDSPRLRVRFYLRPLNGIKASILTVDQKTFEKDVDGDWLGSLLVENILTPYEPLVNSDYFWDQEVKAKKRIVKEILGNLISEFPELSHEALIKPEYFLFENMVRKTSLFPPIAYRFLNILRDDLRRKNLESMMMGFRAAIEAVADEGHVTFFDEHIKITKDYIDTIQSRRLKMVNIFKTVRSGLFFHAYRIFPKTMHCLVEDYRLYSSRFGGKKLIDIPLFKLEDPKKYIFISTSLGYVSLSDKVTIEDFVRRTVPGNYASGMELKKLGGVLNAVYVLSPQKGSAEQKIVVKVFKDWYGWKWFPLALWAIGTRGFAVLGKSRLEKEYAINKFLSSQGIHVPKILYVSPKERLIFEEFVRGTDFAEMIKQTRSFKKRRGDFARVAEQVGREIARVHRLDVALGDCKPENIIITPDGRVYFVDLEQAERGADQAWDVAELLYYSGHYISFSSMEIAKILIRAFIEGYLGAGGKIENIEKARSPRYVKVFSFFTSPYLILSISNACGEIMKNRGVEK